MKWDQLWSYHSWKHNIVMTMTLCGVQSNMLLAIIGTPCLQFRSDCYNCIVPDLDDAVCFVSSHLWYYLRRDFLYYVLAWSLLSSFVLVLWWSLLNGRDLHRDFPLVFMHSALRLDSYISVSSLPQWQELLLEASSCLMNTITLRLFVVAICGALILISSSLTQTQLKDSCWVRGKPWLVLSYYPWP